MSTVWDVLGLEAPTGDLRAIKKAYAKKLRVTRPDDDPEGFMALREALEQATHYAQYSLDEPREPQVQLTDIEALEPVPEGDISTSDEMIDTPIQPTSQAPAIPTPPTLMEDVHAVMQDPFARADIKRWTFLFRDQRLDAIDEALDFEEDFRSYLLDLLGYYDGEPEKHNRNRKPRLFSTRVGNHIFKCMNWRDVQGRPFYVQDQLEWLRQDLDVLNRSSESHSRNHNEHIAVIEDEDDGISAWKIAIGLLVIINIVRILLDNFANSSF